MHQLCEIYRGTIGVQIPTNLRHKGHICLLCVSDKIWPPALLSALREGGHVGMVSVDDSHVGKLPWKMWACKDERQPYVFLFFRLCCQITEILNTSAVTTLQNSSLYQTKQASSRILSFSPHIGFVYRSVDRFFFFQKAYHLQYITTLKMQKAVSGEAEKCF